MKFFSQNWHRLSVIATLFVGLFLRLYQIGNDPFWFDEINVLQVVSRPTLWEAIKVTHEHVMAMPLHYALVWLVGKVSTSEGWMRLPEAIWGTLAIAIGYVVARYYLTPNQALLSAWLMATSPLLIMYSQELRFYAGLVFFYLLVTFLGIRAIERNQSWSWLLFCIVGILGLAFHVHVLFSLWIVYAYLGADLKKNKERGALRSLIRSTIVLLIAFLGLLLSFGRLSKEPWNLVSESNLIHIISAGIGLAAPFPLHTKGWIYYFAVTLFTIVGVLSLKIGRDIEKKRLYLLLAVLAQIAMIVVSNLVGKYFIAPRQFIFLSAFFYLFTAVGTNRFYLAKVSHWVGGTLDQSKVIPLLLLAFYILCVIPAILQYYRLEKGIVKGGSPCSPESMATRRSDMRLS
ncbi:MAG: glycosyltransferase family 39 protein [Anaerolineales bacterium]|nr:glycosyltransferase family 39 protein [Anaerolineales bacterium]